MNCVTCSIVAEYASVTTDFADKLAEAMQGPALAIFYSVLGLAVVLHGFKMMFGKQDFWKFATDMAWAVLSALILGTAGPTLVAQTYTATLALAGGASSMVLTVVDANLDRGGYDGMVGLAYLSEKAFTNVFFFTDAIARQATITNWMPHFYGLLLLIPFAAMSLLYFAQVVISIFRLVLLAAFAPVIAITLVFGWGRGLAAASARTLLSSVMVLTGVSIALALVMYTVLSLDIASPTEGGRLGDMPNAGYLLAVAMGWLGAGMMLSAVGIANSITGSALSNGGAILAASGIGLSGAALAAGAKTGLGGMASGAARAAGYAGAAGSKRVQAIHDRLNTPIFDK